MNEGDRDSGDRPIPEEDARLTEIPDPIVVSETQGNEDDLEELVSIVRSHSYSGPVPPPGALAEFEEIQPGLADRIVVMAESQAEHRRSQEKKLLDADIEDRESRRKEISKGQSLAFGAVIVIETAAVLCAFIGQPVPASIIGIGGLVGLVTAFLKDHVYGNTDNQNPTG